MEYWHIVPEEATPGELIEAELREEAAQRSETHLTLGRLISYLEHTADHPVPNLTHPHSYRGYYSDLAFEWKDGETSSKSLLEVCKVLLGGGVLRGYKGGEYQMSHSTPLWVANWGEQGRPLIAISNRGTNLTLGRE